MHIFAAELDLVELLLDFWVKIPSLYKSVKLHWFIFDDQLCGVSGLPQWNLVTAPELLCTEHMTVAAVFLCRECGIYFCCLLSPCSYKERQVCVYIYAHIDMHGCLYTQPPTHRELCWKTPSLFFLSSPLNLMHPWLFDWRGPLLKIWVTVSQFVSMCQQISNPTIKTPPSINTQLGDT